MNIFKVILGPVSSKKTTELIETINKLEVDPKHVCTLKVLAETQNKETTNSEIVSKCSTFKLKEKYQQRVELFKSTEGDDIMKMISEDTHYVFVDEGQFLSEKQVENLCKIACGESVAIDIREVYFFGLLKDANNKMWPASKKAMELGSEIINKTGKCKTCGKLAGYSRLVGSHEESMTTEAGNFVKVGGENLYIPVCMEHYSWSETSNPVTN